jgi:hypothetical protein
VTRPRTSMRSSSDLADPACGTSKRRSAAQDQRHLGPLRVGSSGCTPVRRRRSPSNFSPTTPSGDSTGVTGSSARPRRPVSRGPRERRLVGTGAAAAELGIDPATACDAPEYTAPSRQRPFRARPSRAKRTRNDRESSGRAVRVSQQGALCGYSHGTAGRVHTPPWHWSPLISPLSAASSSPWWRPRGPTHPGPHLPTRRQRPTRRRRRAPRCPRPRRFPPLSAGRRTTTSAPAPTTSPGRRLHSAAAHPPHLGAPSTGAPTPQPAPRGTEGRPTSRRRSPPTRTPRHPGRARHGPSRRCRPRHRPLPHHGREPRRQTRLPPVRRPRPLTTPTGHLHRRRHEPPQSPRRRRAPPAPRPPPCPRPGRGCPGAVGHATRVRHPGAGSAEP